jgi:Flp pilus assembly protein TadG
MTTTRRRSHTQRTRRASNRGQVMPIFALVVVVLFAATGLAVDAGMAYLTYNGAERAAAAAALAGVPYMPTGLSVASTTSCAGTAAAAACAATARDGFANGTSVNGHNVVVTVSRYPSGCGSVSNPCADNKLQVQVTAYVQPTFLHVLGFTDHPVAAVDTAFYLPPISLGQPGAQLGSSEDQLGTSSSYYFLRSEGYGNPRTEGDAYDPYNQQTTFTCGNSITTTPGNSGNSTDVHALSENLGTDVTAGTMTGLGYQALPSRGGYDFTLTVPSTVSSATTRVYNPAFAPDGGYTPTAGNPYNMHEQDGSFSGNTYTDQYSAMEYTIFKVTDRFDHTSDTPWSQVVVDPLNITTSDPNGGTITSIVDVRYPTQVLTGTSTNASIVTAFNNIKSMVYHQWVDIGAWPDVSTSWTDAGTGTKYHIFHGFGAQNATTLGPGSYRLRVDMLDYQGLRPGQDTGASPCSRAHKGYAIQLATGGAMCADPGCQVSALDELAVYTPIVTTGLGGFSVPLFQLPADYAGQTVNFFIYDPGDVTGTNAISILSPDDASCGGAGTAPCTFSTTSTVPIYDLGISRTGASTSNELSGAGGDNSCSSPVTQPTLTQALVNTNVVTGCGHGSPFFNGRWLQFQLQIPSNYAGGYSTTAGSDKYWRLHYSLTSGTASDTFTIAVNYANSPVHLL